MPDCKFIVDAMFGNIAKKLRMCGYDSVYNSEISDEMILEIAQKQNRMIITKDFRLSEIAQKNQQHVILLTGDDEASHLSHIMTSCSMDKLVATVKHARCTICNKTLHKIQKDNFLEIIPGNTAKFCSEFYRCNQCNKIFWDGTHITNLQNYLNKIKLGQ